MTDNTPATAADIPLRRAQDAVQTAQHDARLRPIVTPFLDKDSSTFSYVVQDPSSSACAVIDCVMGFDLASGTVHAGTAKMLLDFVETHRLDVQWLLETHLHADHLSAAPFVQQRAGGKLVIGARVTESQAVFATRFNTGPSFRADGSQFDILLGDGESFPIGALQAHVLHVPGHTPGCIAYVIGDVVFVGDTLFMPDVGTARCDFPGGCARALHASIQRIFSLPGSTRMFMCHDYPPSGRSALRCETTVDEQRASNIHIHDGIAEEAFVHLRNTRDATLAPPRLMLPALQINMRAGHLPPAEDNGTAYLKIPLKSI